MITWLIKAENEGDGSAPPSEEALQQDSRALVVAGRYWNKPSSVSTTLPYRT